MPAIRFGVELPQHMGYPYLSEMASAVEELGFDSLWLRDHLIVSPFELTQFQHGYIENDHRVVGREYLGCLPVLAAIAASTSRITIGTDILNIPRRNPVDIANEIATIDQISGGRVILQGAIGQPFRDWAASGVRAPLRHRGAMLEEALTIIRALWIQDEPYSFHGRYYDIEDARIGAKPVQRPHPPIWLGVESTFDRVARLADGFTLSGSMFGGRFDDYLRALQDIRERAHAYGRADDAIEPAARFGLVMSDDVESARARARDHWGALFGRSEPWYTEWAGDADTVCRIIEPWVDAGVTHVMLWPVPYLADHERLQDLEYFARNVIPRFR